MDYFVIHKRFAKFVSFLPLELRFIPEKYKILKYIINALFFIFWHVIVLHLFILQMKTFHLNLDESLDETINYLMTGSIYGYGYFILCYMQTHSIKFLKLIDFANKNFRTRSAKGRKKLNKIFYDNIIVIQFA